MSTTQVSKLPTPPALESANCYVVAGNGTLTEGQEYEVRNQHKGTFTMLVTRIDGEWITGTITKGVAKATMRYNVRDVGEEVTVRECHSYFIPVGKTNIITTYECEHCHNQGSNGFRNPELCQRHEADCDDNPVNKSCSQEKATYDK